MTPIFEVPGFVVSRHLGGGVEFRIVGQATYRLSPKRADLLGRILQGTDEAFDGIAERALKAEKEAGI